MSARGPFIRQRQRQRFKNIDFDVDEAP